MNRARLAGLKRVISRWIDRGSPCAGTVISFPKSGRTWLRVMLDQLDLSMAYTHAGSEYTISCHFADLPSPRVTAGPGRQFFLFRDPRDTVISGYFQKTRRKKQSDFSGSIAEFIRDPKYGIEKIIRFNLSWLEFYLDAEHATHRAMSYEQLRASPAQSLSALYEYLAGRQPYPSGLIENVVDKASFSRMQAQERSGELGVKYGSILTPANASDPESMKVRKGKVGGFVDYMSEEDIAFSNAILHRFDYSKRLRECAPVMLLPHS